MPAMSACHDAYSLICTRALFFTTEKGKIARASEVGEKEKESATVPHIPRMRRKIKGGGAIDNCVQMKAEKDSTCPVPGSP